MEGFLTYNFELPCSELEYVKNYQITLDRANTLLGRGFGKANPGQFTFLGQTFQIVIDKNKEGDKTSSQLELMKIWHLLTAFERVQNYDRRIFKKLKERFLTANDIGNYFGIKSEILTAGYLAFRGAKFTLGKPGVEPDFVINFNGKTVGIEVTSTFLAEQRKDTDLVFKILQSLRTKEAKNYYAISTVALFMDYTNLLFESKFDRNLINGNELISLIKPELDPEKFGNLTLSFSWYMRETKRWTTGANRIDNKNIDPTLKDFLDSFIPVKERTFEGGIYSRMF